jgi:iron complex outermembrane receptor protein
MLFSLTVSAQNTKTVSGTVVDETSEPAIGASVVEKGNVTNGVSVDLNGRFELNVAPNAVLIISYMGYTTQELSTATTNTFTIVLKPDAQLLEELVVIGYGSVKKKDLTGSITSVSEKDFQKGSISTPDQLIMGKVAGVSIITNGGQPGSGSRIRIRGGSSLNASNDPLIVLDGVPMDNTNVAGSPSLLSTINPNDIESMNILKDASATAIYGSRASNGVIIITTKKGLTGGVVGDGSARNFRINFSTQGSISTISNKLNLLTGDEVREIINNSPETYPQAADNRALLGTANTDWQDQIYQTAFGTDNNLSISGNALNTPYRVSLGYLNEEGTLKTGKMERLSGAINLTPRFIQDRLRVDINARGTHINNRYANKDAIASAAAFDPTQSVYDADSPYGGYYTWVSAGVPNNNATKNPVALLNQKDDHGTVNRFIGNVQADYRFNFLPELRVNVNAGYDWTKGEGSVTVPAIASFEYARGGVNNKYEETKKNVVFDSYLNYNKFLPALRSNFDVMAGYSYQDWLTHTNLFDELRKDGSIFKEQDFPFNEPRHTLVSFYGRLNYTLMDKYLLTVSVRRDGSSRFSPDTRWGTFPSAALAWKLKEESFFKNKDALSDLKLRLGYGITGQQDGIADYSYLPVYGISKNTAQYQLGNGFYQMYRPAAYDENIKWETTATYNAGLDFGFWDGRLSGAVDVYFKKTSDLLSVIPVAAGSNFANELLTNIGNVENKGIEFTLNAIPVETKEWTWDIGFNLTYNDNKVTKLTQVDDPSYKGVQTGDVDGGTGTKVQIHSVGYNTFAYYLYQQVYDTNGNPIEGAYVDRNGDGVVNEGDLYRTKSPEADVTIGFSTSLRYKKWSLSTSLRASFGNYVFNNVASNLAAYRLVMNPLNYIQNSPASLKKTQFYTSQYQSDYYLENASFLKMDNLMLSYNVGNIFHNTVGLRLNANVQNVFTLTDYTGLDPEIAGGIDRNFYPRSRTFTFGLTLDIL